MTRGLSNPCFSNEDDHFISLMRMFDEDKEHVDDHRISFPKWIEKYYDYSHAKHTQAGVHDLSDLNLKIQRKMGVLINMVWTVEMKDPIHLSQYCAFKSIRELSSYVDVIGLEDHARSESSRTRLSAPGLEILVATVNTKVRDVNVHTNCAKGLLLNWTLEPERMLKIINNMGNTNQKKPSTFHMLKVAETYHDVIERGFNRYAWVVAYDLKGHDFEYHDPEWRQFAHVFSIVAKLMLHHLEDKEFWIESMPILIELCFHFKDAFDKSDGLECRLNLTPKEIRRSFLPIFKGMKNARVALDDEHVSEQRQMLQRGVEAREKGHETGAQGGEKRKAGDDGEGGAKKQKTSAA
ncbi:hypothetical protein DER46DRAFT_573599 [Fusarium sp. MPI-SDFR-AT-0072]|nr:hypothetical protein DER46DRAFT_573599 [Fusarium sp. MPI-SDFR-AT-0072]